MNETPKDKKGWRILRRVLIGLAILATLMAIFYTEEDWRGKRAWENCKRELEAKGAVLDWDKYIPPSVPDDQNFFKAPNMTLWFVKGQGETNLSKALQNTNTHAIITSETAAKDYLAWSDTFESEFEQVREALNRPGMRIESDYSQPFEYLIPNFVMMRSFEQVLAQRAKCYLLLGRPDQALREATLMHDLCRILERPPARKPILLVDAMVDVAINGLYVSAIADGLQRHAWQEPQLIVLQAQLQGIDLPGLVGESFHTEQAAACRFIEIVSSRKVAEAVSTGGMKRMVWFLTLMPHGWIYQNMVTIGTLEQKAVNPADLANHVVSPRQSVEANDECEKAIGHFSPFALFAAVAVPNFIKAKQVLAQNQTLVNEAQIVCALERYRLLHGEYPETLDILVPQFIEKLPHDIIGGQPLHYHRSEGGKFLLYSIGWNETDDGGEAGSLADPSKGDWVWKN